MLLSNMSTHSLAAIYIHFAPVYACLNDLLLLKLLSGDLALCGEHVYTEQYGV